MSRFFSYSLIGFAMAACSANAAADRERERTTVNMMEACDVQFDFSDPQSVEPWRIVNDGVMGGLSQGTRFHEDEQMVFRGTINTNGGGFSSLRYPMEPGLLNGAETLRLRVKSDGRAYRMTFRTSERFRGRSVSYQAPMPQTAAGEWADIIVPLTAMETSVFGFSVPADPFDPSDVREMGIILADGVDGDFRLEIASIACAAKAA